MSRTSNFTEEEFLFGQFLVWLHSQANRLRKIRGVTVEPCQDRTVTDASKINSFDKNVAEGS